MPAIAYRHSSFCSPKRILFPLPRAPLGLARRRFGLLSIALSILRLHILQVGLDLVRKLLQPLFFVGVRVLLEQSGSGLGGLVRDAAEDSEFLRIVKVLLVEQAGAPQDPVAQEDGKIRSIEFEGASLHSSLGLESIAAHHVSQHVIDALA